jgi:hypothetical protein
MVANYQYPHYLYVKTAAAEATQAANGSWVAGTAVWTLTAICREETNGKGASIVSNDGRSLVFSSLIQLPARSTKIVEGSEIMVLKQTAQTVSEANAILKGTCLKFDDGRLHCRMWV